MNIGGDLWFRVGLEFPSVEFRFVSFVSIPKRLHVSILFSGCCLVLCCFFFLYCFLLLAIR